MTLRPLVPLLAALALAACGSHEPEFTPPKPVASLHVDRVRVQYAASFAAGSSELPYAEATRLETFLDQASLRPDDRVLYQLAGRRCAHHRPDRPDQGASRAARRRDGGGRPAAEGIAPNHVVVLADRYVVTPPACPGWSDSPATGHDNMPNSNFGCATLSNFALMVDNPRDLMTGRTLGPADAEPTIESVERYRTGQSSRSSRPARDHRRHRAHRPHRAGRTRRAPRQARREPHRPRRGPRPARPA